MGMNSPYTINPYRLAEQISGEPITWKEDTDERRKQLADILGLLEEDLYDIDNPVIYRHDYETVDGKIQRLTEEEQLELLITYLEQKEEQRKEKQKSDEEKNENTENILMTEEELLTGIRKEHEETRAEDPPIKEIADLSERSQRIIACLMGNQKKHYHAGEGWTPSGGIWAGKGIFFNMAPTVDDPTQGSLGDCYFIAALASVAWSMPYSIVNRACIFECDHCSDDEAENVGHLIPFYTKKQGVKCYDIINYVEVSDLLPVKKGSLNWIYGRSYDENETWPAVYEKAYAKYRNFSKDDCPEYEVLNNGWIHSAMVELVGGVPHQLLHEKQNDAMEILRIIQSNCDIYEDTDEWGRDGHLKRTVRPMGAVTWNNRLTTKEYQEYNLAASHCYSVLGWDYEEETGLYYVVLRNPWGCMPVIKDVKQGEWKVTSYKGDHGFALPLNINDTKKKKRWSGIFAMELHAYFRAFYSTAYVDEIPGI